MKKPTLLKSFSGEYFLARLITGWKILEQLRTIIQQAASSITFQTKCCTAEINKKIWLVKERKKER
jgi:hypothetical protein